MSSEFHSQPSSNPFQAPPSASPPPPRRSSAMWVIGIGLLASMCLCGGPCIGLVGFGVYQAVTQRDDVERVIDQSLKDIGAGRIDEAMSRVSKRAKDHHLITRETLEELESNPAFQGCDSVHITHVNVSAAINSNSEMPQGTVAKILGTVDYKDGGHGTFQATLERENGQWRIHSLRVERSLAEGGSPSPTPEAN